MNYDTIFLEILFKIPVAIIFMLANFAKKIKVKRFFILSIFFILMFAIIAVVSEHFSNSVKSIILIIIIDIGSTVLIFLKNKLEPKDSSQPVSNSTKPHQSEDG